MELKQIEYFIRIAELGSFTKASIELNVAQPALSRQIRLLEVELRQVAERALIIPSRPNAFRVQLETQLAALGLQPQIAIEVDAISGLIDMVAEGLGSAILPGSTIETSDRQQDLSVCRIIDPPMLARLYWAVSARRPTSQVQRHLIQLLDCKVRELIKADE